MEDPKININFNIDVNLDSTTPYEIKAQIEDAVIRAATAMDAFKRMGYTEKFCEPRNLESQTNHQRVVAANTRISDAIKYIDHEMRYISNRTEQTSIKAQTVINLLQNIKELLLTK